MNKKSEFWNREDFEEFLCEYDLTDDFYKRQLHWFDNNIKWSLDDAKGIERLLLKVDCVTNVNEDLEETDEGELLTREQCADFISKEYGYLSSIGYALEWFDNNYFGLLQRVYKKSFELWAKENYASTKKDYSKEDILGNIRDFPKHLWDNDALGDVDKYETHWFKFTHTDDKKPKDESVHTEEQSNERDYLVKSYWTRKNFMSYLSDEIKMDDVFTTDQLKWFDYKIISRKDKLLAQIDCVQNIIAAQNVRNTPEICHDIEQDNDKIKEIDKLEFSRTVTRCAKLAAVLLGDTTFDENKLLKVIIALELDERVNSDKGGTLSELVDYLKNN